MITISSDKHLQPPALRTAILPLLLACLFLAVWGGAAFANDNPRSTADPMIKITSLPIKQNLDEVMAKVSKDVARDTGLDINFITYYWQTLDAIHCPGCEAAKIKKPIFVDLYVPGFMTKDEIQKVMTSLAKALAKYTDYTIKDLFMHAHVAEKWQLFIMGDLVTNWKQVGGPDDGEDAEPKKK